MKQMIGIIGAQYERVLDGRPVAATDALAGTGPLLCGSSLTRSNGLKVKPFWKICWTKPACRYASSSHKGSNRQFNSITIDNVEFTRTGGDSPSLQTSDVYLG